MAASAVSSAAVPRILTPPLALAFVRRRSFGPSIWPAAPPRPRRPRPLPLLRPRSSGAPGTACVDASSPRTLATTRRSHATPPPSPRHTHAATPAGPKPPAAVAARSGRAAWPAVVGRFVALRRDVASVGGRRLLRLHPPAGSHVPPTPPPAGCVQSRLPLATEPLALLVHAAWHGSKRIPIGLPYRISAFRQLVASRGHEDERTPPENSAYRTLKRVTLHPQVQRTYIDRVGRLREQPRECAVCASLSSLIVVCCSYDLPADGTTRVPCRRRPVPPPLAGSGSTV